MHLVTFLAISSIMTLLLAWTVTGGAVVASSRATTTTTGLEGRTCESIQVPMCKGMIAYNTTILPNRFGHRTQAEVYWALQPWWPFIDAGCSNNLRGFLCGLYLPRCAGDGRAPHYPCTETCRKAKVRCSKQMRREHMRWMPEFQCHRFLPKSSKTCIRPDRERKKNKNRQYVLCEPNNLPLCRGIPFAQGSLPNMFLQGDLAEIEQEMAQFKPLMDSGCSRKLRLFMCGVYMPFCVSGTPVDDRNPNGANDFLVSRQHSQVPFVVPCRELCQEVYDQCSGEYQQRTNGLPWPGKFHCHRFPSYVDRYNYNNADANVTDDGSNRGASVSCTMPPYNYDGN